MLELTLPAWILMIELTDLLLYAVYLLDAYTIFHAVYRGHGVERTLAWIFAILAFPGLGALLYLLLAGPSVRRTTKRKKLSSAAVRRAVDLSSKALELPESRMQRSILYMTTALTGLPPTAGNSVELLAEDDRAFERIEQELWKAKQSIWAEYYIIRNDETGRRFLNILKTKAGEGVEVRLLYDAVGSFLIDSKRLRGIESAGGKVKAFLPLNPFRRRYAPHLRNHRKMIIVDHETAFTGGMNVGDEYSGRARRKGLRYFHDIHLALSGPAVSDLALIFAEDWTFATDEPLKPVPHPHMHKQESPIVAVLPSGPDQEHNTNSLMFFSAIALARERVYLTSPYFIPDEPTYRALVSAALRGVDVKIIVPAKCDILLAGSAARAYYPQLVRYGVQVFEYQPSMLHAKTLVTDGAWSVVGSANLDIRSFRLNFELNALVVDPAFARILEQRFLSDLAESTEVTMDILSERGFVENLRYRIAGLLSPLL